MSNPRKRGAGYAVEVYDATRPSRKRYIGTFPTQREAREAKRRAEQVTRHVADETVAAFAARWLELRPRQKASTNAGYAEAVAPFVARHGERRLRDVGTELALEWVGEKRWTLGGVRAMFSDARRAGLIETNPFTGLRLRGSRGRKDLDVLTAPEVDRLADTALAAWPHEVGPTMRALILCAAYVGLRPSELYGLRWSDLDLRAEEVLVQRQYAAKTRTFELPKNGLKRLVVLTAPAKAALLELPRPVDAETLIFRASRGGPMSGRVQHYYWHPIRTAFGRPSMDLYELRHFCGSWLFNDLELPAQDVAHQLGHTDGGALVQRLYGHPSQRLARERIKRAAGATPRVLPLEGRGQHEAM